MPWWYITSCWIVKLNQINFLSFISKIFIMLTLSCCVICWCAAWLFWCFCMSTAANASARLNNPSFKPEKISPCRKHKNKTTKIRWKIKNLKHNFFFVCYVACDLLWEKFREAGKGKKITLIHHLFPPSRPSRALSRLHTFPSLHSRLELDTHFRRVNDIEWCKEGKIFSCFFAILK